MLVRTWMLEVGARTRLLTKRDVGSDMMTLSCRRYLYNDC